MKRQILTLFAAIIAISGIAQTIGEAFYIYRNDGMINTFFRSEIDSITYSYLDLDSVRYDEIITQVVYTPDSIYRIPLALVDSVGFVTPETVYKPGVVRLEGAIRDYIIGSDSLTVFFRADTPSNFLPKVGDKLVTTEMSETFEIGFAGEVSSVYKLAERIEIICTEIDLSEVFETYYGVTELSDDSPKEGNSRTKGIDINVSGSKTVNLGTYCYEIPSSWMYSQDSKFDGYKTSIAGHGKICMSVTCIIKACVIVNKAVGTYIGLSTKTDLKTEESFCFSGKISEEHKKGLPLQSPPIGIIPFVRAVAELGVFFKTSIEGSIDGKLSQHYQQITAFEYSSRYEDLRRANFQFNTVGSSYDISSAYLNGSVAVGAYLDFGYSFVDRRITKAYFSVEGGVEGGVHGSSFITNQDVLNAKTNTDLYNRLRSSYIYIDGYYGSSLKFDVFKYTTFSLDLPLGNRKRYATRSFVPKYSEVSIGNRRYDSVLKVDASTEVSDACFLPVMVGFNLFDENKQLVDSYYSPDSYESSGRQIKHTFGGLKPYLNYTLYPTVIHDGVEMLAEPSAELKSEVKVSTLDISDITEKTAVAYGKIEGIDIIKEKLGFGIGYRKKDGTGFPTLIYASEINEDGTFSVLLQGLEPNTTYCYFAYILVDEMTNEIIEGAEKEFTTKGGLCPDENHPHMIDLGLPSGTKWSCCNVGASSPEEYGDYYSWGNTTPNPKDNYWLDDNYPFIEWIDVNNDGFYPFYYWDERFIKLDEAYNSAVSASWGNGSLPTKDDFEELYKECDRSRSSATLGSHKGLYLTGKNGNRIFIPFTTSDRSHYDGAHGEYWTYNPGDNRAWYCGYTVFTYDISQTLFPLDESSERGKISYCRGRTIRSVSK